MPPATIRLGSPPRERAMGVEELLGEVTPSEPSRLFPQQ